MRALPALFAVGCFPSPSIELPAVEGRTALLVIESAEGIGFVLDVLPFEGSIAAGTTGEATITLFVYDATLAELRRAPISTLTRPGTIGDPLPAPARTLTWPPTEWSDVGDDRELRERILIPTYAPIACVEGGGCIPRPGECQNPCVIEAPEPDEPSPPGGVRTSTAPGFCPAEWRSSGGCVVPTRDACTFVAPAACAAASPECSVHWPPKPPGEVRYVEPGGAGSGLGENDPSGDLAAAVAQLGSGTVLLSAGVHDLASTVVIPGGVRVRGVCGGATVVSAPGLTAFASGGDGAELSGVSVAGAATVFHNRGHAVVLSRVRAFESDDAIVLDGGVTRVEDLELEGCSIGVAVADGAADIARLRAVDASIGVTATRSDVTVSGASFWGGVLGIRAAGGQATIDQVAMVDTSTALDVHAPATISRLFVRGSEIGVASTESIHLSDATIESFDTGVYVLAGTATITGSTIDVAMGTRQMQSIGAVGGSSLRVERTHVAGLIAALGSKSLFIEDLVTAVDTEDAIYTERRSPGADLDLYGPITIRRMRSAGGGIYSNSCAGFELADATFDGGPEGQDATVEVHCSGTGDVVIERVRIDRAPDGGLEIDCGLAGGDLANAAIQDLALSTDRSGARGVRIDHCRSVSLARVRVEGAHNAALSIADTLGGPVSLSDVRVEAGASPPEIGIELLGGQLDGARLIVSRANTGAFLGADRETVLPVTGHFPIHVVESDVGIHTIGVPTEALETLLIGVRIDEARARLEIE
jgi:hypothetical protein